MNLLFLIGSVVFLGTFGGRIFQKLKIPQVVGYIIIGVLFGKSVIGVFGDAEVAGSTLLINFTLGVIGFLIGSELKITTFKRYGKQIYTILLAEGLFAFVAVTVIVTLITHKLYLGLILGAIASATDPASTVSVLWEYKARGPLTTTLTSIVALDDGLALILYGLVSHFSRSMITGESMSWGSFIGTPLWELSQCILLGAAGGFIMVRLFLYLQKDESLSLAFMWASVATVVGLSIYLKLDIILPAMIAGAVLSNRSPRAAERIFKAIKEMSVFLYILFFIVVGASLDIRVFMKMSVAVIIAGYLFARSFGKIFGAMLGALCTGAKKTVRNYTGVCLFTQGGVAMGLAMSISTSLAYAGKEAAQLGDMIISIVAATTFVVQILGPFLVKLGIVRADEAGRNVTMDDIIATHIVKDFMRRDFSFIPQNATLDMIMEIVKESQSYHFPVIGTDGNLVGLITLGELRGVFREYQLDKVILARDVAMPLEKVVYQEEPLKDVFEIFEKKTVDYLAVVKEKGSREVVGVVEYQPLLKKVHRKLLEHQQGLEKV